jgi:hypothetical protein
LTAPGTLEREVGRVTLLIGRVELAARFAVGLAAAAGRLERLPAFAAACRVGSPRR